MSAATPTLSDDKRREVIAVTDFWLGRAKKLYGRVFPSLPVLFDLHGRCSCGMFCRLGRRQWFRFNPGIFAADYERNLTHTVPHEVAHYVCHRLYGRRAKPHGEQWRSIMVDFGVPAKRLYDGEVEGLSVRSMRYFRYQCACREHRLSAIRHNRVRSGRSTYHCLECKEKLVSTETTPV